MENKNGRPTKWKAEFIEQARKLCELGATDKKLAEFFNIGESTLNLWKSEKTEFLESIKSGKEKFDTETVERALLSRAIGLTLKEVKHNTATGETVETLKEVAPDTTAIIYWLKNRQPSKWRDKTEVKHEVATVTSEAVMEALRRKHNNSEQS